ncbi:unnamed protein product [Pedinophyceae sp. YPF-701]|nr:unnamed protein product [Pedinophyceae sp. YPF-701]
MWGDVPRETPRSIQTESQEQDTGQEDAPIRDTGTPPRAPTSDHFRAGPGAESHPQSTSGVMPTPQAVGLIRTGTSLGLGDDLHVPSTAPPAWVPGACGAQTTARQPRQDQTAGERRAAGGVDHVRVLVYKTLTNSDAAGRVILPRAGLESAVPLLQSLRTCPCPVVDDLGRTWSLVLKAWANGNETRRVYIIEPLTELMKAFNIGAGATIALAAPESVFSDCGTPQRNCRLRLLVNPPEASLPSRGAVPTPVSLNQQQAAALGLLGEGARTTGSIPRTQNMRCTRSPHCSKPMGHPGFCRKGARKAQTAPAHAEPASRGVNPADDTQAAAVQPAPLESRAAPSGSDGDAAPPPPPLPPDSIPDSVVVAKRLTNYDVDSGRMILPRAAVETQMPCVLRERAWSVVATWDPPAAPEGPSNGVGSTRGGADGGRRYSLILKSWSNGVNKKMFILEGTEQLTRDLGLGVGTVLALRHCRTAGPLSRDVAAAFAVEVDTDAARSALATQATLKAAISRQQTARRGAQQGAGSGLGAVAPQTDAGDASVHRSSLAGSLQTGTTRTTKSGRRVRRPATHDGAASSSDEGCPSAKRRAVDGSGADSPAAVGSEFTWGGISEHRPPRGRSPVPSGDGSMFLERPRSRGVSPEADAAEILLDIVRGQTPPAETGARDRHAVPPHMMRAAVLPDPAEHDVAATDKPLGAGKPPDAVVQSSVAALRSDAPAAMTAVAAALRGHEPVSTPRSTPQGTGTADGMRAPAAHPGLDPSTGSICQLFSWYCRPLPDDAAPRQPCASKPRAGASEGAVLRGISPRGDSGQSLGSVLPGLRGFSAPDVGSMFNGPFGGEDGRAGSPLHGPTPELFADARGGHPQASASGRGAGAADGDEAARRGGAARGVTAPPRRGGGGAR